MRLVRKGGESQSEEEGEEDLPKQPSSEQLPHTLHPASRQLAFQKNYPKNIFIPLIEHLRERGLQQQYEECVGTRESFEGKNVVSLAEIHQVMSQQWFGEGINFPALVSNISNKILMNSKIKKKLFHLLLVRELFSIPLENAREFKKLVSRRANEVAQSHLPDDPLFAYPSALIYLLSLLAERLIEPQNGPRPVLLSSEEIPQEYNKYFQSQQGVTPHRNKEVSSKEEYKYYIGKIINALNAFQGDPVDLHDRLSDVKDRIISREAEVRQKYRLPQFVPDWCYFGRIVIDNCFFYRRDRIKLTFSLLNQWIQEFKEKSTSLRGFEQRWRLGNQQQYSFKPIVLVQPPL